MVTAQQDTILLFPLSDRQEIDACTSAQYDFEITNAGTFADTFLLSVDPLSDSVQFNESVIFLLPGEFKVVTANIFPPCGLYGNQRLTLTAESAVTGTAAQESFTLNIKPTHIPLIADGIERIRITFDRSGVLIPISNLGDKDTTYELILEGESWMRFSKDTVNIPQRRTDTVQLITEPDNRTIREGEYPATIVARVDETGVEYAKEIVFVLKQPTWVDTLAAYWWVGVLGVIGLIIIFLILGRVKTYLDDTHEERMARKEEKRRERERQARDREVLKAQKAKEKEKLKEQKEKERLAKIEEKAKLRAKALEDKETARHLTLMDKVTGIFLKELRREYKYKPLEGEGGRFRYFVALFLLIAVAAAWFFWDQIAAYWTAVGAGILAAIVLLVLLTLLLRLKRNSTKNKLSEKDQNTCRDNAIKQLKGEYELIKWENIDAFYPGTPWGKIVAWALLTVALIAGAVWTYMNKDLFFDYAWMSIVGVCATLAALIIIVAIARRRLKNRRIIEREYGELNANKYETIQTQEKWGLHELSFKLKHKAESALLRVNANSWNTQPIAPEGKVFRYFAVDHVGFDDKDVEKVNFRFAVKKSWMRRHNIAENKVKLMRFTNGKWTNVQSTSSLQGDDRTLIYEASHTALSLFAIVGEKDTAVAAVAAPRAKETKKEAKEVIQDESNFDASWLVYSLIALLALAVLTAPLYLNNPADDVVPAEDLDAVGEDIEEITDAVAGIDDMGGIPPQTWPQDTTHTIDLGEYFTDPDQESLSYTHTPVEHVDISYSGDVAQLTPEAGWTGEGVVVFTATDSDNATVDSNPVRLRVTMVEPETNPVDQYGTYVLLALVFLVILLIASSLFRRSTDLLDKE